MAVVTFVTFNAPTKIWSRTTGGIIAYPSTVTAAPGGPYIVNPIIVPFDPVHETGGSFWRLTEGPNIGFLVSAHSNSLGYGDITITYDGQPDSYAEGIAKINPLAAWRLLIKDMGGETGGSSHMLTFNDTTFVWSRTTTGIIKWPHEFEHDPGGPYAVNPIVVPFDPEHETGGSFWRLTEGPFTGFLVSFHSNELGYGDITVEDNPDFDRGPGAVLATLGPGDLAPPELPPTGTGETPVAHLAGASLTYNTPGEMHFTLLVDSPHIDIPQPKRTHYAIEFWDKDNEVWFESFAGWIWDFDATDTEVVFYGIDYLGAFQYTVDERYDPELGIDVAAPNGSKYTNKTIREIVIDQLEYAIGKPNSMVGFVALGDVCPMPYVISAIYSTFKDTLGFVTGLIDSHRAGTGKQSRISVRKIAGVYTVIVEDDPGLDRHNLLIQYGGLAQGYRAIPFGVDWASRVNFIGRNKEGLKVMYRAESSAVDQGLYGRIAGAPVYMDTEDYNDMKRRALQAAIDASRIGRQISVGLKLGSFRPLEGYDICDNLPLDINHGAVTTKDWGSDDFGIDPPDDPSAVMASFWTILGISWESYDDGHWMTGLTLYPRGKRPLFEENPCADEGPTPDGYYAPLRGLPAYGSPAPPYEPNDNVHYWVGGTGGPHVPSSDHSTNNWGFPQFNVPSGDLAAYVGPIPDIPTAGVFDTCWSTGNAARCIVVGPGTMTILLVPGTGGAGPYDLTVYCLDGVSEHTVEFRGNQTINPTGVTEVVVEIPHEVEGVTGTICNFWVDVHGFYGGTRLVGFGGFYWQQEQFGLDIPGEALPLEAPEELVVGEGPPV